MFRYRMNAQGSRRGLVVVLVLVGLLLIWVASTMGDGQTAQGTDNAAVTQTDATTTEADNLLLRIFRGLRAAGAAFWGQWSGGGDEDAVPVSIDLTATQTNGSGEEDPEEEPAEGVEVEVVDPKEPDSFATGNAAPQVLIYHTHTHEAYTKTAGQNYVESAQWRTTNNDYNIVKVGEELAKVLWEKYGIAVLHDTTDTEAPKLGTAYARSLKVAQKDLDANPSLKLLIDLHRDAYNTGIDPSAATIDGVKVARVMTVIGTGEGKTGTGFAIRPDWQKNKKVADDIISRLKQFSADLTRGTDMKTQRYNQHLSTGSVLIEVGHNKNTLDEALAAVPYLAEAIAGTLADLPTLIGTATASPKADATATPTPTPTPSPSAASTAAQAAVATPTPTGIAVVVDLEPLVPMQSNPP